MDVPGKPPAFGVHDSPWIAGLLGSESSGYDLQREVSGVWELEQGLGRPKSSPGASNFGRWHRDLPALRRLHYPKRVKSTAMEPRGI